MPKISIILPVFNIENLLNKCLDSIKYQTYENIEVVCVDDGSTDKSGEILDQYANADTRFKVIHTKNQGAAVARNVALDAANGDYVMFCDSDDWYESAMCEQMLSTILEKNVDLVSCDFNLLRESDNYARPSESWNKLNLFGLYSLSNPKRKAEIRVTLWNKIFKKQLIDQFNIRFPELSAHEDAGFIEYYMCVSKSFYGINKCLYNHRMRTGSIMHNIYFKNEKILDRLLIEKIVIEKTKEMGVFEDNYEYLLEMCWSGLFWVMKMGCENKEQRIKALDFLNENVLFDLDLDLDFKPNFGFIKELKKIKKLNYDNFLERFKSTSFSQLENDGKIKKRKSFLKKFINFLKSYLFFPYYVYQIYLILRKKNQK